MTYIIHFWKFIFVIPHLLVFYFLSGNTKLRVQEDITEMNKRCQIHKGLAYYLVFQKAYRNLYYYRVGGKKAFLLNVFLPKQSNFFISSNIKEIGGGAFVLNHPYGTIINCKRIGDNLTICQLTTIGNALHGRNDLVPSIGNNVSIGANVNIIGNISIGNNVIIGAGSVVVKDIPNNCIIAGNPAKIIKVFES